MKEKIADLLKKALDKLKVNLKKEEIKKRIEIPPSYEMGDYAFPCFFLAEKFKQQPYEIALEVRKKLKKSPYFEDIQTSGPYVNFFLDKRTFVIKTLKKIIKEKENFGKNKTRKKKKTMVEFPSPNTNKPLHLGHLRNMSIGESISRVLEFNGEKAVRANLNNDRGIHICKSMLAYKKYGKGKKPLKKQKPDHFVGDFYVKFNQMAKKNKNLEKEVQELLRKWEEGDKETISLWKKMNNWALKGFEETYKKFGIKHDKEYFESELYEKGKKIIEKGVKDKVFEKKKDNSVSINLEKENLGEKILLRSDGTSVYITQDLYLAIKKLEEFDLDKSLYVVGNEQKYHFEVLFSILEKLGYKKEKFEHLSYGMVNLPEGKMKSREGIVIDADDIIDKVQGLVKKELNSREKLSKEQLEKRSLKIALAAIKYMLLKVDINKNMIFNPKKSINFEGDTGSYILYTYARASSILQKANKKTKSSFNLENLESSELKLAKKISRFQEIVTSSYENLNPSIIANYSYSLSKIFNEFYHQCPVINSENKDFRLTLVEAFKYILKNSLYLLGVDTIEKM